MVTKGKRQQNTVKIDEILLERIKNLFNDEDIRIEYPTIKNFIDVAVLKLLKEKEGKNAVQRYQRVYSKT